MLSRRAAQAALLDDALQILQDFGERNVKDRCHSWFLPQNLVENCPRQPIVRLSRETGERELTVMRWGPVPYWSKDAKVAFSTINAKAETITTSQAFREAMKRRRCLVPVGSWELHDKS